MQSTTGSGFFSSLFLVPKKDRGWHRMINLKKLNEFITVQHWRLSTTTTTTTMVKRRFSSFGDWSPPLTAALEFDSGCFFSSRHHSKFSLTHAQQVCFTQYPRPCDTPCVQGHSQKIKEGISK